MKAGSRADERARRVAERVARDRAALAALQSRVDDGEAEQRNWRAGADGERATAAALDQLTASGWLLLHDVHWPGRPKANLDHVAVGPGGVVVIDSKNWSTAASVRNGLLWTGRYPKRRECDDVARMVASVAALLAPEHRGLVRGAMCLVQQDVDATRAEPGVVVVGVDQLVACLRALPAVLEPSAVQGLHTWLAAQLDAATSPVQLATGGLTTGTRERRRPQRGASPGRAAPRPRSTTSRRPARRGAGLLRSLLGLAVAAFLAFQVFPAWLGGIQDAVSPATGDGIERVEPVPDAP